MQDVLGKIRESKYEDKWSNGIEKNGIASAKFYSPVAYTSNELDNVSFLETELSKEMIDGKHELDRSGSTTPLPRTL